MAEQEHDAAAEHEHDAAAEHEQEHDAAAEPRSRSLPVVDASSVAGGCTPAGDLAVSPAGMDRRHALKVMAIAAAAPTLAACATDDPATDPSAVPTPTSNPKAAGTAWDPDLVAPVVPWERSLTPDELEGLAVLCDVIVPADERSPAASTVGAPDFIDEWVSAPYDGNRNDAVLVRGGLVWLDRESATRFGEGLRFRDLDGDQQRAICDDICYLPDAEPGYEAAARFFDRVRDLTSTAFWTTAEGMRDLEYIGNMPLQRWDPPPPEVLRHIGVEL